MYWSNKQTIYDTTLASADNAKLVFPETEVEGGGRFRPLPFHILPTYHHKTFALLSLGNGPYSGRISMRPTWPGIQKKNN